MVVKGLMMHQKLTSTGMVVSTATAKTEEELEYAHCKTKKPRVTSLRQRRASN
jgi:hypothetical protein